jgi:DNA-binding IclR family transcriptional regulator
VRAGSNEDADATAGPSVASRLFAILDAFTTPTAARALSLTEISQRAGLPLSTTHRMVAEWTDWGGLTRLDDGRYSLGLRLWEIGVQTPTARNLRTIALPYLEDLYEATREHVHLAILDGRDALYVEKLSGHKAVHVISRVGGRLPLHATGVGLVLLGFAPAGFQAEYLDSELTRFTPATVTDPEVLRRRLAEIRATGIASMSEEMTPGSSSIAAPVRDRTGQVVAAVSVVIRTLPGVDPEQDAAVRAAARGISRTLGYRRADG